MLGMDNKLISLINRVEGRPEEARPKERLRKDELGVVSVAAAEKARVELMLLHAMERILKKKKKKKSKIKQNLNINVTFKIDTILNGRKRNLAWLH